MEFLSPQLVLSLASLFAMAAVVFVRPWFGVVFLIFGGALGRLAQFPELNWDVMDVVGVLTGWSALLYLLVNRRSLRTSPLDAPVLLLGATVLLNLPRAADEYALSAGIRFLAILTMYFIAVQILDNEAKVRGALIATLCAAGFVAALTIAFFATGQELYSLFGRVVQFSYVAEAGYRLGGPFGQPNALGQVTALAVPLGLALTLNSSGLRRWLFAALIGVCTLCTLMTQSRSAIGGLVVGSAVVAFLARVRLRTAVSSGLALMLFAYILSTRVTTPEEQILWRFENVGVAAEFRAETGVSRLRIARAALNVFWENPMGVGFGGDIRAVGREMGMPGRSSHNILLRFAVELGIPGLLAGIWLVYRQLRYLWEVARHGTDHGWRLLGSGCLGAAACCWFHNMFHDTLHSGYVWIFFAAASAVCLHGLRSPARTLNVPERGLARA